MRFVHTVQLEALTLSLHPFAKTKAQVLEGAPAHILVVECCTQLSVVAADVDVSSSLVHTKWKSSCILGSLLCLWQC